jgi:hypothetical protein
VSHRLDSDELRRAGLAAMAEVVRLLGVQARWVIFGHTHCAGPLPWMDRSEWALPGGGMLLNTGCWTDEPRINSTDVRSPYRPGRGVLVDGDADPEPLMLVEDVGRRQILQLGRLLRVVARLVAQVERGNEFALLVGQDPGWIDVFIAALRSGEERPFTVQISRSHE